MEQSVVVFLARAPQKHQYEARSFVEKVFFTAKNGVQMEKTFLEIRKMGRRPFFVKCRHHLASFFRKNLI